MRAKLGLAAGLVLAALVVTVGAAQARISAPTLAKEREELINRIQKGTGEADRQQKRVDALRDDVSRMQREALKKHGGDKAELLALLSGSTQVTGPGVKLVVDDAKGAASSGGGPRESSGFRTPGGYATEICNAWSTACGRRVRRPSPSMDSGLPHSRRSEPQETPYWSTTSHWRRLTRCWRWGRAAAEHRVPGQRRWPVPARASGELRRAHQDFR